LRIFSEKATSWAVSGLPSWILNDCEFISVAGDHYDIASVVSDCCDRHADFSDLINIGFCKKENLYVMTDDADYADSGLDIITANKRLHASTTR
jgi:hypothetical protein